MRVLAALFALVMFASACGGSGGESPDTTADAGATEVEQAAAGDDASTDNNDDGEEPDASDDGDGAGSDRTLDDYLGTVGPVVRLLRGGGGPAGSADFDVEAISQQQLLVEEQVQICMREQGFEYEISTTSDPRLFLVTQGQGLEPLEYAQEYGYGISTSFDSILEGEVDLSDQGTDPNSEYLDSLSDGEADAWNFALQGEPPQRNAQGQVIDPETGEPVEGGQFQAGGCRGDAQAKVFGDINLLSSLTDEFDDLDKRIENDPRMIELAREWTDCMVVRGFTWETEAEAREHFQSEFRPLIRSYFIAAIQASGTDFSAIAGAAGQGGGGQGGAGQGGQGQGGGLAGPGGARVFGALLPVLVDQGLSDEQEAELSALQALEIEAAIATVECKGDTQEEIDEIAARYEAEFVAANRAVLEQFAGG